MNVLMSAYACEPNRGSEPGIGWNWAVRASTNHDVWVITQSEGKKAIIGEIHTRPYPRLHFVFHDVKWIAATRDRLPGGRYVHYLAWQFGAYLVVRRLQKQVAFDVGHHVTFGSMRFPSFLIATRIPFVWGPIGGAEIASDRFYAESGLRVVLRNRLRRFSNKFCKRDPFVRLTGNLASKILVSTPETQAAFPAGWESKCQIAPAMGFVGSFDSSNAAKRELSPLKVLYAGRLEHWKGVHLTIQSVHRARKFGADVSLTVVGSGTYERALKDLVAKLDLAKHVRFVPWLKADELSREMSNHNVLSLLSLQDSGGFVVLEAFEHQLPVICLDIGGPSMAVRKGIGFVVEANSPTQVVADVSRILFELASSLAMPPAMTCPIRERLRESYGWGRLPQLLDSLYATLHAHP